MGSHVDSKVVSSCARVVAMSTSKRFLSAVNQHVSFQLGRSVARIATLVALVILLCIKINLSCVRFVGHLDISLSMACASDTNVLGHLSRV